MVTSFSIGHCLIPFQLLQKVPKTYIRQTQLQSKRLSWIDCSLVFLDLACFLPERNFRSGSPFFRLLHRSRAPFQVCLLTGWYSWTAYVEYQDGPGSSSYVHSRWTQPFHVIDWIFSSPFLFFSRLKASLPLSLACLVFLSFHYLLRLVDSWHQSRESKTSSSWSVAHLPNLSPLWLSISPRILAIRIEKDQPGSTEEEDCHFSWTQVWKAYRSPHVLLASLALFMTGTNLYSLAYFQPTSQSSFFFFIFFPMGCLWLTFYLTWVIFHDRMNEHSYSFREFFFHFVFWKQDSRLYCIGLYVYIISPVHQFGYSRSYTQLISVPPFAVGFFGQSNYHLKSSDMKLRNLMLLGSHDLDILFLRSLPGSWIHRNPMCGRRRKWYKHYLCSSVPLIWHLSFGSYLDIYFSSSIPHTTVVMCHSFSRLQEYTLSPPRSTPGLPITPCHIIDEQLQ